MIILIYLLKVLFIPINAHNSASEEEGAPLETA
jgi:hypothetical protein